MGRAEKFRPLVAREELEQLGGILRLAFAVEETASFNELLDAMDQGPKSSAANRVPGDMPEKDC